MMKRAIEDGINYVSYFMGSMALDARARLKVNDIVPRVGLHRILMRQFHVQDYTGSTHPPMDLPQ